VSGSCFCLLYLIHILVRVLLATIRDNGNCPCPHCLIPRTKLDRLGHLSDSKIRVDKARKYNARRVNMARKAIYTLGNPIGSVHVEQLLKPSSIVPTSVSLIHLFELIVLTRTLLYSRTCLSSGKMSFDNLTKLDVASRIIAR
jgi:hypothetical protein